MILLFAFVLRSFFLRGDLDGEGGACFWWAMGVTVAEGWFEGMIASPSLSSSAEKLLLFLVLRGVVPFLGVFF
jgi:hypothetical protein